MSGTELYFPLKPRPREDPYAAGVVQANLEHLALLFEKGLADGDVLTWDETLGRFVALPGGGIEVVTTLPITDIFNGREIVLTDSLTAPTFHWHLRYNEGSSSSYKWECLGGTPAHSVVDADQSTTSITYTNLSTPGPDVQLPSGVGGDFLVEVGCVGRQAIFGREARMSYDLGSTAAIDIDSCIATMDDFMSISSKRRKNGVSASALIRARYRTSDSGASARFVGRWLSVVPYRVG